MYTYHIKTIVYQPEPILQIILKIFPSGWCYRTCQGQGVTHFYGNLTKWFVLSSKVVFSNIILKFSAAAFCSELLSSLQNGSEWKVGIYFCSTERKSGLFSLLRKDSNGIPRASFHFCSTEWNSELLSLPRKGSERNSEIFCSAEQPEFRRK